jgi:hypothetical protein
MGEDGPIRPIPAAGNRCRRTSISLRVSSRGDPGLVLASDTEPDTGPDTEPDIEPDPVSDPQLERKGKEMSIRYPLFAAGAAAIALTIAAAHTQASTVLSRRELLTFNRAVALPGVQLVPGTYAFELDPNSAGVVRVQNRVSNKVEFMGFTYRIHRPAGKKDSGVVLGEARRGEAPPVLAWYPSDQELGYQFIYRDGR